MPCPIRDRSRHSPPRSPRLGVHHGGAKRPPSLVRAPLLREPRGHPPDRAHGASRSQPLAWHGPRARAAPDPPPGTAHWRCHPGHGRQRCLLARRTASAGPRALPGSGAALCSVAPPRAMSANTGLRSEGASNLDPAVREPGTALVLTRPCRAVRVGCLLSGHCCRTNRKQCPKSRVSCDSSIGAGSDAGYVEKKTNWLELEQVLDPVDSITFLNLLSLYVVYAE